MRKDTDEIDITFFHFQFVRVTTRTFSLLFIDVSRDNVIHKDDLFLFGEKATGINRISNNNATRSKYLIPIYDFHIVRGGSSVSKMLLRVVKMKAWGCVIWK